MPNIASMDNDKNPKASTYSLTFSSASVRIRPTNENKPVNIKILLKVCPVPEIVKIIMKKKYFYNARTFLNKPVSTFVQCRCTNVGSYYYNTDPIMNDALML